MAASADQILTVLLSGLIGYGGKWAQEGKPSQHTPESLSGDFRDRLTKLCGLNEAPLMSSPPGGPR